MAHELVTEYGQIVDAKLRASLVTKDNVIFNTYYEGVPTAGAVKIPVRDGEAVVADYNKTALANNGIKYGSTGYITAVISQDKYVNEYIDGYEAEAVPDNLVADRLDSAGYSLANTEDSHALQTLVNGAKGKTYDGVAFSDIRLGLAGTNINKTITKSNVYEVFVDMMVALDEAKVPAEGRYAIVSPAVYAMILQDSNFIRQAQLSQELLMTGAVGMIAGFILYKSNKLAALNMAAIAGHPSFATRIDAWKVEPKLVDLTGDMNVVGGSAVKGRFIYTHEVTKPQAFAYVEIPTQSGGSSGGTDNESGSGESTGSGTE